MAGPLEQVLPFFFQNSDTVGDPLDKLLSWPLFPSLGKMAAQSVTG